MDVRKVVHKSSKEEALAENGNLSCGWAVGQAWRAGKQGVACCREGQMVTREGSHSSPVKPVSLDPPHCVCPPNPCGAAPLPGQWEMGLGGGEAMGWSPPEWG